MPEQLTITKDHLRAALLQWETDHRAGLTRTHAETDALPTEQVVDDNVAHLWTRLANSVEA